MSYSLEDFCDETRTILSQSDDPPGREKIRQALEKLLVDSEFCAQYLGPDHTAGLSQIYEDPKFGFCVLVYNMAEPRTSPPHDHGESWAVYGQAVGYTDMTIWSAPDDAAGNIEATRTFRLEPGQAGLFDVREIHSIQYASGSKFVRVTGVDMSRETRRVFDPATGAVREIEHVGAGKAS